MNSRLMLICVMLALASLIGCTPVGPGIEQTADATRVRVPATNPLTVTPAELGANVQAGGAGTTSYLALSESEARGVLSSGVVQGIHWHVAEFGSLAAVLATDSTIQADQISVEPKTRALMVKNLRITLGASEPTRALEPLARVLVTGWQSMTEAQRDARLAEVKALEASYPGIVEIVTKLIGGL
jgi:hypothetical protein